MEHRMELENLLLAGLPDHEREQTIRSMRQVTERKLAHKRSQRDEGVQVGSPD